MAGTAPTLQQLYEWALTEMNEDLNSPIGILSSGTGSYANTFQTLDTMTRLFNDAKDHMCRTCYLYPVSATLAITAGAGPSYSLGSFTLSGTDKALNDVAGMIWTPSASTAVFLTPMSYEAMMNQFPLSVLAPTSGTPQYWADERGGFPSILIPVLANSAGTLTVVNGYGLPADLVTTADTMTWIPQDRYRAVICYACAMLCRKRVDDANLVSRYPEFCREYDDIRANIRADIDDDLAMKYLQPFVPFAPPIPGDQGGGNQVPGTDGGDGG